MEYAIFVVDLKKPLGGIQANDLIDHGGAGTLPALTAPDGRMLKRAAIDYNWGTSHPVPASDGTSSTVETITTLLGHELLAHLFQGLHDPEAGSRNLAGTAYDYENKYLRKGLDPRGAPAKADKSDSFDPYSRGVPHWTNTGPVNPDPNQGQGPR